MEIQLQIHFTLKQCIFHSKIVISILISCLSQNLRHFRYWLKKFLLKILTFWMVFRKIKEYLFLFILLNLSP